jgi:hypothetical protein
METKIPIYECKVMGTDNTGIFAISFVELPANEHNFVTLGKQRPVKLSLDKQKQILTGVVLIPEQPIYRYDEALGEYYIKFTAPDIEKIALKMMKTGLALSTTTHQHEKPLKGNYLTEIWIVSNSKKDKAAALGLGELPVGTLMASYKIEDAKYWHDEVLSGNVKGFSLEGIFNFKNVTMKKDAKTVAQLAKEQAAAKRKPKGKVAAALAAMFNVLMEGETETAAEDLVDEAAKDEVDAGDPFLIFELAEGGEVWVDADGYATKDGEQMPAGEHALSDGNFIVIDDSGMLVVTQPEADGADADEAAAELAKKTRLAKERAKHFFARQDPKDAKIAALEKLVAELKGQPSTKPAEANIDGAGKKPSEMTYTEKMAAVIRSRNERRGTKK